MRRLKTILVACVVASSLLATAGTAWARTSAFDRGTSWTERGEAKTWGDAIGASWEMIAF